MATNHVQAGKTMQWTNGTGAAVSAGDVVRIEDRIGVALEDIANGSSGTIALDEVWDLPKINCSTSAGEALMWDDDGDPVGGTAGTGAITDGTEGNCAAGFAFEATVGTDTHVKTKING